MVRTETERYPIMTKVGGDFDDRVYDVLVESYQQALIIESEHRASEKSST